MNRALYGLRAPPKLWNEFLTEILLSAGWEQSLVDAGVFFKGSSALLVHVDDIIVSGECSDVNKIFALLRDKLLLKEQPSLMREGETTVMLGRTIRRCNGGRFTIEGDCKLIDLSVDELGLANAKSVVTPSTAESTEEGVPLEAKDHEAYRRHVGRLLYISADRVDVQFVAKTLARKLSSPTSLDWLSLKRVVRYLRARRVLRYVIDNTVDDLQNVKIWVDADWASCRRTRRSTSGGIIAAGSSILTHYNRTQSTVALSSCESELHSLVTGINELIFVCNLIREMGFTVKTLCAMSDNKAAIDNLARLGVGKLKHVSLRSLHLQELCRRKLVVVRKVPGGDNWTDVLTKAVSTAVLNKLLSAMALEMPGWNKNEEDEEEELNEAE